MPPSQTDISSESQTAAGLRDRRFKLSRACDRCRRRRIKCDEGHPCQACITANSSCTFEEPGKRSHPHKSKRTATLEDRLHHLETLIQAIPRDVFASTSARLQADTNPSPIIPFPAFPSALPPPALLPFPIVNPSTHFTAQAAPSAGPSKAGAANVDSLTEAVRNIDLTGSYFHLDHEGYTRWQGESSGMPLLDLLVERYTVPEVATEPSPNSDGGKPADQQWFPNRSTRRKMVNRGELWFMITAVIPHDLMDTLIACYFSTSYHILPIIHVPTFLADYSNAEKWDEPGFAAFVVAICCLASRHMDDPRVYAVPTESISAGARWFELLNKIRTMPEADAPTLYNIQANLIAGVYSVGQGRLSKGAALLSEAISLSTDIGLHRSAETFDIFDPIEDEVRKRTFWCVYIWDKQLAAHLGKPPMIRLRDCDVGEPLPIDDEYIKREGVNMPPDGTTCRMSAFVHSIRTFIVLESVLSIPPTRTDASPFMQKANALLSGRTVWSKGLREEEALLDEIHRNVPSAWSLTPETLASKDPMPLTQAVRLHCAELFVRLLIYRHRFGETVADRATLGSGDETSEGEREAMICAHRSAVEISQAHMLVWKRDWMTYYGVHVIHQLTQAGRTLVAVLLNCRSENLQHLIPSGLEALKNCVFLLKRFSGRYVCGLRNEDLMVEFCRLAHIPLNIATSETDDRRPPWIRPVKRKTTSTACAGTPDFSVETPRDGPGKFEFEFDGAAAAGMGAFGMGGDAGAGPAAGGGGRPLDMSMYMTPEMLALFGQGAGDVGGGGGGEPMDIEAMFDFGGGAEPGPLGGSLMGGEGVGVVGSEGKRHANGTSKREVNGHSPV